MKYYFYVVTWWCLEIPSNLYNSMSLRCVPQYEDFFWGHVFFCLFGFFFVHLFLLLFGYFILYYIVIGPVHVKNMKWNDANEKMSPVLNTVNCKIQQWKPTTLHYNPMCNSELAYKYVWRKEGWKCDQIRKFQYAGECSSLLTAWRAHRIIES